MATSPTPDEPQITVSEFVGTDAGLSIPVAGLLVASPSLADAVMPAAKWREALDKYLASPRPAA